jgi:hypothetical protein
LIHVRYRCTDEDTHPRLCQPYKLKGSKGLYDSEPYQVGFLKNHGATKVKLSRSLKEALMTEQRITRN